MLKNNLNMFYSFEVSNQFFFTTLSVLFFFNLHIKIITRKKHFDLKMNRNARKENYCLVIRL